MEVKKDTFGRHPLDYGTRSNPRSRLSAVSSLDSQGDEWLETRAVADTMVGAGAADLGELMDTVGADEPGVGIGSTGRGGVATSKSASMSASECSSEARSSSFGMAWAGMGTGGSAEMLAPPCLRRNNNKPAFASGGVDGEQGDEGSGIRGDGGVDDGSARRPGEGMEMGAAISGIRVWLLSWGGRFCLSWPRFLSHKLK
jgi:hypothetical protein